MPAKLQVHPAFYRRVRHYRDRIGINDGRPQVASNFTKAAQELVLHLLENPRRGHSAGFEASDLADILRVAAPGIPVFALFYRWDGQTLAVITLEHTAQDLPSRLVGLVPRPENSSYAWRRPLPVSDRGSVSRSQVRNARRSRFISTPIWLAKLLRVCDPRSVPDLKTRLKPSVPSPVHTCAARVFWRRCRGECDRCRCRNTARGPRARKCCPDAATPC